MPVLSGAIGIGTAGHLENALTFSPLQLVIDTEIAGCVRKLLKGIEVSDETLSFEAIQRVGQGGNFTSENHTLDLIMEELDASDLFDCVAWDVFESSQYQKTEEKALQKVQEILARESEPCLTPEQERHIDEIVREAAAKITEDRIETIMKN